MGVSWHSTEMAASDVMHTGLISSHATLHFKEIKTSPKVRTKGTALADILVRDIEYSGNKSY